MTDVAVTLGTITVNSSAVFPAYNFSTDGYITTAFALAAGSGFTPTVPPGESTPASVFDSAIGFIGVVGVGGGANPNNFVVALKGNLPRTAFASVTFPLSGGTTLTSASATFNGPNGSADGWSVWMFANQSGNGYSAGLGDVVTFHNVDIPVFNCDCESVSPYATLASVRTKMMIRLGYPNQIANPPPGMATLIDQHLRDAQEEIYMQLQRAALRTERFFRWTMVPGQRYYSFASEEISCELLNPLKVTWVGFEDLNQAWYRLDEGIPPEYYTRANINFGWPTKFELRSCIEIFPAPQAAYTLWIKGDFGLGALTADSDRFTIPDMAPYLLALGNMKTDRGARDASAVLKQAANYTASIVAGSHGTKRYVPRGQMENPLTPPRFLPLGGDQA